MAEDDAIALVDDEIYRRDGALSRLDTCLAVADDDGAKAFADRDRVKTTLGDPDQSLATGLLQLQAGMKSADGYGTLLVCAHIVDAWYARVIDGNGDGSRVHGTIVVDFTIDGDRRAVLKPVPLVRILASPGLLPKASFGGMVLQNADITDAMVFHNVHLTMPLSFAHVRFGGGDYSKRVFGIEQPVTDTAIAIIHSRFDDRIQFVDSLFCGHVRIIDSHLHETLAFEGVKQVRGSDCHRPSDRAASLNSKPPFVNIDGSRFEQSLSTIRSLFGALMMDGNDIDMLISSRTDFGRKLQVWNNDIGSLQIDCSNLARVVDFSYNHVVKDAFIYGSHHAKNYGSIACANWWSQPARWLSHPTKILITSNRIGGGLGLQGLDPATLQSPVDLSSNRVGNGSVIALPAADTELGLWNGRFELNGSTYNGTLKISTDLARKFLPDGLQEYWNSLPVVREKYCENASSDPFATIDFMAARIHILRWNLPLDCRYRWLGYGLSYDLWLADENPEKQRSSIERGDHQGYLKAWRQMLVSAKAAPLNAMSDYLTDNGSSVDGREILREAKRLNYAQKCPPDLWTHACLWRMIKPDLTWLWPDGEAIAASTDAADVPTPVEQRNWFEHLASALKLALLWPGGFGAAPEQALFWLFGCTLICWLIYAAYAFWLKHRLEHVPLERSRLRRIRSTLIIPTASVDLSPGRTGEPHIEDAIATIDDLCDRWPIETNWPHIKRDERLEKLSKILIPGLLRCEELLTGSALGEIRAIRRQLELFGNTEKLGFSLFDGNKMPVRFTYGRYAIDTMLPFIDLHAYNNYYPEHLLIRVISVAQHVCGWWWITVFIASAAIL